MWLNLKNESLHLSFIVFVRHEILKVNVMCYYHAYDAKCKQFDLRNVNWDLAAIKFSSVKNKIGIIHVIYWQKYIINM